MIKVIDSKVSNEVFKFFVNGGRETLIYQGEVLGEDNEGFIYVNDREGIVHINKLLIASKIQIIKKDVKRVDL